VVLDLGFEFKGFVEHTLQTSNPKL
jgi:hypothetical protein